MIKINIKSDVAKVTQRLQSDIARQVPFATAKALTATALKVREAQYREMRDVFDRPTPYTLRSLFVKPATKSNQIATVWLKDSPTGGTPATKYLGPQIAGGQRGMKRFELALRARGVLPDGWVVVPGSGASIDGYGNWNPGELRQILSYFGSAEMTSGYSANMTQKRKDKLRKGAKSKQGFAYFVGRPADGKLPFGIWKRVYFAKGTALKPVALFVPSVLYEAVYDFRGVADRVIKREFDGEFAAALAQAVATAR